MPITSRQRRERRRHLGASEVPAVLGMDPWRTPADVYYSKVYEIDEADQAESAEIGEEHEKPLIAWAARELGMRVRHNVRRVGEGGILACHLDAQGLDEHRGQGIEAKTTSDAREYGEEHTDQVPDRVILQTQAQMYCADLEVVSVPVLTARFDRLVRLLYEVKRNERLIGVIVERATAFWREHVEAKIPPPDSLPSLELLSRIRRVPQSCAVIDPNLAASFEAAAAKRKAAESEQEVAKAALLAAGGDAEAFDCGEEGYWYTYLPQKRRSIDERALRLQRPEVVAEFQRETEFRVLRHVRRTGGNLS